MNTEKELVYQEVQKMRQVTWIMLIVFGIALLIFWGFVQQIILGEPWGTNPAPDWMMWLLLVAFGFGLPLFFLRLQLVLGVYTDHILIDYRPLTRREIPFSEINQAKARRYDPIREYAGWGIKGWSSQKVAYNVKGKVGVELILHDGRRIMLGSQNAPQLELAIQTQLSNNANL